jgi:flagellar motor switch protein FliN
LETEAMSDNESKEVPLPDLEGGSEMAAVPDAGSLAPGESENDDSINRGAADLEAVFDVPVQVSAVLGRARMEVGDLLKLGPGAVLELDRKVGEAIDIYVNNRLIARGEVVLVEDKLGVTMTEIIKADRN